MKINDFNNLFNTMETNLPEEGKNYQRKQHIVKKSKELPPYIPQGDTPVVTRFAPSPTGLLHLGGARTALFNWLFARHYGGKFLLRLEDTDQGRSKEEFTKNITETLLWLGLQWDDAMVVQSQNKDRHKSIAESLLASGHAYRCYCSPEELETMKEEARAQGKPPIYNGKWRNASPEEEPKDQPFVVRLKAPREGLTSLLDGVQGSIEVQNQTLDDMVLLRSDGTPTYMLAVVVDDHDMGVTHIIRGDDHLTNAFRQLQLYDALGWTPPFMFHVPLIHGMDGKKLSKRFGAKDILDYQQEGILPHALVNTLMRLGWSHGDEERISPTQAIEWFDGTHLSKAAARFDEKKLLALNAHYLRQYNPKELWNQCLSLDDSLASGDKNKGLAIMEALCQRVKTLRELSQALKIYVFPDLSLYFQDKNSINPDMALVQGDVLEDFYESLKKDLNTQNIQWSPEFLEPWLQQWCENKGIALKDLAASLRVALTGTKVSPPLPLVFSVLGHHWILLRLQHILEKIQN